MKWKQKREKTNEKLQNSCSGRRMVEMRTNYVGSTRLEEAKKIDRTRKTATRLKFNNECQAKKFHCKVFVFKELLKSSAFSNNTFSFVLLFDNYCYILRHMEVNGMRTVYLAKQCAIY